MLACAESPPAPPEDEAALLDERARLIALLRQVDERIRAARRQEDAPPSQ